MSLHRDLLDQAGHLAKREPKRPKQASLRRAVSASYYAVFHLLIDAASRFVVRGNNRTGLRHAVTRAFDHGEMKSAANTFKGGTLPSVMQGAVQGALPTELKRLCETFIELQQARHEADYDLTRVLTRSEALDLVTKAQQAFTDWETVAGSQAGDAFLGRPAPSEEARPLIVVEGASGPGWMVVRLDVTGSSRDVRIRNHARAAP